MNILPITQVMTLLANPAQLFQTEERALRECHWDATQELVGWCVSHIWLCDKSPQISMTQNNNGHLLSHTVGQEFGNSLAE